MDSHILRPFDRDVAITTRQAMRIIGATTLQTARNWAERYEVGRRSVGSQFRISLPALLMALEENWTALAAYHLGQRDTATYADYLRRARALKSELP
ncbi:hypothetical protein SLNSH_22810 [Alsobacter soli]|uniref:Uncharacterized protein n=1 Tax=Alsobacter soli TaxID=2109933 RepID=A0A2T1HM10_9HYPH|nr:hypothetical protein [Alsobacter soli]PSC02695.1 hypothetical protein SLNSH_22810 [Alsobacter soli]